MSLNSIVRLQCEPNTLSQKLDELCANFEGGTKVAIVHEAREREPASLEFREYASGWESFAYSIGLIFWKKHDERTFSIRSLIDRNLTQNAQVLEAMRDIEAGRSNPYVRFFNLHIFRKKHRDDLHFLPQIYLKIWQQGDFCNSVMYSMQKHLSRFREIARTGINDANQNDRPDIYFTSSEGERVYAHSNFLSGISSVKNLERRGQAPFECPLPQNFKPSTYEMNLFLDVMYGIRPLTYLKVSELNIIHDIASALEYDRLRVEAFKRTKEQLIYDLTPETHTYASDSSDWLPDFDSCASAPSSSGSTDSVSDPYADLP